MYHRINVVWYPFWRALGSNLVICAVSPVLLINTLGSKSPVKSLRLIKRSQEEENGSEGLLER